MIQPKRLFLVPFALVVFFGAFFVGRAPVAAADVFALTMYDVNFVFCFGASVEGNFKISATNAGGVVINSATPVEYTVNFESNLGAISGIPYSSMVNENRAFAVAIGAGVASYMRVYAVSVDNPNVRTNTFEIRCDGTVVDLGGGVAANGQSFSGIDDRINRSYGDLVNVLYPRRNALGQPEIQVYSLNRFSQGVYEGKFAYSDFAPYLSNPPAVNTLIARVDESTLYALSTGEFQINVEDEAEGKLFVIIFRGLPPRNLYYQTLD